MATVRRDTGPQDIPFQTVENYQGNRRKSSPKAENKAITFDDSSIFPKADCQLFQHTVHHIKAWQTHLHRPIRKSNILDLFFCPNELINTIVVSDSFISDHRMITVETNIPVHGVAPKQIFKPPSNKFAVLDFHKADWPNI